MVAHAGNTFKVTCVDCGAQWNMHWPCEGTEQEIRFGVQRCAGCDQVVYDAAIVKNMKTDCGRPSCPMQGEFHEHTPVTAPIITEQPDQNEGVL